MKKEEYYLIGYQGKSKFILYLFFGVIVFIVIFFPFFAINMRYQMGYLFSKVFNFIGSTCLTLGGVILVFSVIQLLLGGRINTRWLIVGIVLLWVGSWCTGTLIELFGIQIGINQPSDGYHEYPL